MQPLTERSIRMRTIATGEIVRATPLCRSARRRKDVIESSIGTRRDAEGVGLACSSISGPRRSRFRLASRLQRQPRETRARCGCFYGGPVWKQHRRCRDDDRLATCCCFAAASPCSNRRCPEPGSNRFGGLLGHDLFREPTRATSAFFARELSPRSRSGQRCSDLRRSTA